MLADFNAIYSTYSEFQGRHSRLTATITQANVIIVTLLSV